MGNQRLKQGVLNENDEDMLSFSTVTRNVNIAIIQFLYRIQQISFSSNYFVSISNFKFYQVKITQRYQNTSVHIFQIKIPIINFKNQEVLLSLKIIKRDSEIKSSFVRFQDIITKGLEIVDIQDPDSQLTQDIQPNEVIEIEYLYLDQLRLCQNSFFLCKIPFQCANNCQLQVNFQESMQINNIISPSHKIQIDCQNTKVSLFYGKYPDIKTFILLFDSFNMNKVNIQIQKALLGDQFYDIKEKFCAMITYLPSNVEKGILEDFFYLNFGEGNCLPHVSDTSLEQIETLSPTKMSKDFQENTDVLSIFSFKNRQITIFVDRSNSMEENFKIQLTQQALKLIIKSLPQDCYFNIFSFGSKWEKMFQKHQQISEEVQSRTLELINNLEANMGSTFIYDAMKDAIQMEQINLYEQVWLIITDGFIAQQQEIYQFLKEQQQLRVFTIGLGEEFDKYMVEQIAYLGKGEFCFVESFSRLNFQIIELLQVALSSYIQPPQINNLSAIKQVYPSLNQIHLHQNQILSLFTYFSPEVQDQEIEIQLQIEGQDKKIITKAQLEFSQSTVGNLLQIFALSQYLKYHSFVILLYFSQTLLNIACQEYETPILQENQNLTFYEISKMCTRHQFFNPLMSLQIGNKIISKQININQLKRLQKEYQDQKSLQYYLLKILPVQNRIQNQILAISSNNQSQHKNKKIDQQGPFIYGSQQSLIDFITLQHPDGSFPHNEIMKIMNPIISPLPLPMINPPLTSHSTTVDSLKSDNSGRKSLQIPQFIMDKLWATALALAYLQKNYKGQKGQWLLVFTKAIQYLKQYLGNPHAILESSSTALIQARNSYVSMNYQ